MKYIFVFRGHVLTESTGCVLILTFKSCFEFLQKVFLGLMYPFSCVLWTINSKQLLKTLIDFFVSFITAHFPKGILQHHILLEEMIDRNFMLCIVVHRTLEEETQETLDAVTSGTCR